jgi:gas vesicle protein
MANLHFSVKTMKNAKALFFVAAATFAGGFLAGLMAAPDSGHVSRQRLAEKAQTQRHRLGEHLQAIEKQLAALEQDLHLLGKRFSDQLRSDDEAEEAITWDIDSEEVARELRGMPRK